MDGYFQAPSKLARFAATTSQPELLAALRRDGVIIIENALSGEQLHLALGEFGPWFDRAPNGEGPFFGRTTRRFAALFAKCPIGAQDMILNPTTLPLCEQLLIADDIGPPRCTAIQLNVAQAIGIGPNSPEQVVHRDGDQFKADASFELMVNVMFCLDDFTTANGGTWFVPGSCEWARDRWPTPQEIVAAEAPAGSAIVWVGSMMHGGGANTTDTMRRGVTISYNHAWLAQSEKLLLSIPLHVARALPERAQRLIGYQVHQPSLGWVEGRDPLDWLNGKVGDIAPAQDHFCASDLAIVEGYYAQRGALTP